MPGLFVPALVVLLLGAVPDQPVGYSLQWQWERSWHRVFDRHGRHDPGGPVQQRLEGDPYPEYPLDIADGSYPMAREHAWAQQTSGARMWVHSLDEQTLTNHVQTKTRAPMGEAWGFGLSFDRMETKEEHSGLLRVDFNLEEIGDTPFFVGLGIYSRWEKEDIDTILSFGARSNRWGTGVLRIMAFDTFVNASHALIRARDGVVEEHLEQLDLPLGVRAEYHAPVFRGVRAELYGGAILLFDTDHQYPAREQDDHVRGREGLFAAGLLEWALPWLPVHLGLDATLAQTAMSWRYAELFQNNRTHEETTLSTEVYLLSHPHTELDLEFRLSYTLRPEEVRWTEDPDLDTEREDAMWFWSARAIWMPSRLAGLEVGFLGLSRETQGEPDAPVEGSHNRLLTRCVLQMEAVWVAFGVAWDLDPSWSIYDGGGMTMIVPF